MVADAFLFCVALLASSEERIKKAIAEAETIEEVTRLEKAQRAGQPQSPLRSLVTWKGLEERCPA